MDEVLVCKNLMKRFGNRQAVDDISFAVNKGQCYGLLGPNGAGKTTTISIACGLLERDSGEVYVNGKVLVHTSTEEKKAIGKGDTIFSSLSQNVLTAISISSFEPFPSIKFSEASLPQLEKNLTNSCFK